MMETRQILGSAMTSSEYALMSDGEEIDSSSEQSDSSDHEEESTQGLGFLESSSQQRGIQTELAIYAKWENHTRSIASKKMANMGYHDGMGLGASGQGMLNPISVKVLPPKQSGGKRKLEKVAAALAMAIEDEEEMRPDVLSLINNQLAMHNEALNGGSTKKQPKASSGDKKVDRRVLVAYDYEVKEMRLRVEKLEEMASRNKKEKMVYEAAMRKLNETRKVLAEAEAVQVHASASNAVVSKEKEKKRLKF